MFWDNCKQNDESQRLEKATQDAYIEELQDHIEELQDHKEELERKNNTLLKCLSPEQKRMFESECLKNIGSFEDLSDKHSNTKLRGRFDAIRRNEWFNLYIAIKDHSIDELTVIGFISDFMKDAYEEVKWLTDKRLTDLGDGCTLPSPVEFSDIYRFRKKYGQTDCAIKELKLGAFDDIKSSIKRRYHSGLSRSKSLDSVSTFSLTTEHAPSDSNKLKENNVGNFTPIAKFIDTDFRTQKAFEQFLDMFVECSWLMRISDIPIELSFDVIDKVLDTSMEKRFEKHSTNDEVIASKAVNTIIHVVWPELHDKYGVHSRGIVVTVDESCGTEV